MFFAVAPPRSMPTTSKLPVALISEPLPCAATTLNVCTPGRDFEYARCETTAVLDGRFAASLQPDAPVVLPLASMQVSAGPVSVTMLVRAIVSALRLVTGELST